MKYTHYLAGVAAIGIVGATFLSFNKPETEAEHNAHVATDAQAVEAERASAAPRPDELPMKFHASECANGPAYRALTRQEIISAAMECKAADMGVNVLNGASDTVYRNNIVCIQCDPTRPYRDTQE